MGDDFSIKTNDRIDLIKLSAYRRAISNFVYILTKKNIPVRFSEKTTSSTDGKVVYIGGELSSGEVDVTVGLSLHEGMHIVKSDFELIKNLWQKIPKPLYDITEGKFDKKFVAETVKYILNIVEDRYIDAYAYRHAPGYRGYYDALYKKYYYNKKMEEVLKSQSLRKPTIFAYKFRIANLINKNSDLDALPDLREINKIFDIGNILNLENPIDRFNTAIAISILVFNNVIGDATEEKEDVASDDSDCFGDEYDDEDYTENPSKDDGKKDVDEPNEDSSETTDNDNEDNQEKADEEKTEEDSSEKVMSDEEVAEKLKSEIDNQDEFINRQIKQKAFDQSTIEKLEELEKEETEMVEVECDGIPRVNCVVVKKMDSSLVDSTDFPYHVRSKFARIEASYSDICDAIVLGTMLGNRLKVRGETKVTKFSRQPNGKFDRRFTSDLGLGVENVFYRISTDSFKKAHVHLSIDASSSMQSKWSQTMKTAIAMAKAASMISNLSITISFRSGVSRSHERLGVGIETDVPYIVIAYDSKVDKFNKIPRLFGKLIPYGSTPEGLAFQSILKLIPSSTDELDSYFVNISDGEPYFLPGYIGEIGVNHTKKQIDAMRSVGIEVISYYIEDPFADNKEGSRTNFRTMYGKDAHFIEMNNMTDIAYTMNKRFLRNKS